VRRLEPEALGAFFDRYFHLIHGLAFRLLGNPAQAEDVCQDVFLRVHRGLYRLDTSRDPAPWLAAIVGNACREFWRGKHFQAGQQSVPIAEIGDWQDDHPRSRETPESELVRSEQQRRVRHAILELPDQLREVVVLHDFQALTHQEIATATGASHDAIRKRHSRALARLAEALKERES
jgi:RNA polymerase sigma-70 factor, ECF subfamily